MFRASHSKKPSVTRREGFDLEPDPFKIVFENDSLWLSRGFCNYSKTNEKNQVVRSQRGLVHLWSSLHARADLRIELSTDCIVDLVSVDSY